jgi:predicted small lipoprotein YifL
LFILARKRLRDCGNKRLRAGFAAALLAAAAVTLAACGRAGPPELPPGPALTAQPAAVLPPSPSSPPGSGDDMRAKQYEKAAQNGFDSHGNPVAPVGEKRSFFLDFLLQ